VNPALTPGLILLGATVPIAGGLGWYAWRNRSLPGAWAFVALVPLGLLWAIGDAIELLSADLGTKLLWANVQYFAIVFLPVVWSVMILDYAGHRSWLTRWRIAGLCIVPVATLVILWTDRFHHLMRATTWLDTSGSYAVIGRTWGPWFWVHATYSYALIVIAIGLLVSAIFSLSPLYRRQPLALLLGSAVPMAFGLTNVFSVGFIPAHNYTPALFSVAAIVIGWGLFGFRLFNLIPVARHALVEEMQDGVLVLDQCDRVVDLNRSAQALIGRTAADIVGQPLANCWTAWSQMIAPYAAGANQAELRLGESGNWRHYEVKWSPLTRHQQVVGRTVLLRDVTERALLEESLRSQALTDGLTGLPNRALFMSRLSDVIHQARRHDDALFAVMVLDIDRFKLINDSIGHLAGDVLLQSVATKLKRCVREADTVARMGGDEFIILLHDITSGRDLLPVLERIREELRTPVFFREQEMTAECSAGVVIWDPSYEDPDDLVRAADTAMYQAKEAGRGCHRIFDEKMHAAILRTLKDETDFRIAIRERQFSLAYQPVIDLKTGTLQSLEALLRWHHPERGTVLPDDFINVAETSGLIIPLGEMALDEACSQISRWQAPGHPAVDLPVSVNISPRQLTEPDFFASVLTRLGEWRIPSDRLILEITENALIRDPTKARLVMRKLRGVGVQLCLDDFGAGWSSLQHLTTFPVQALKIDNSFISRVSGDDSDLAVVRSITALAHTLGLKVVAEGVERCEQWRLLEGAGCDSAQGYYIGSPMEPDPLVDYLEDLERGSCALPKSERRSTDVPTAVKAPEPRDVSVPVCFKHQPLCVEQP
jgi:diguanylate cyclase (GGDEF)-like protein/PAS domain S-box-containing protein